jgi:integrase
MKRTSYQSGTVIRKARKGGPDVWTFRYMDNGVRRSRRLGTVDNLKTKAAAERHAAKLLEEINDQVTCIKVSGLCDRYFVDEMPARESTSSAYRSYLKRFKAEWGDVRLDVMAKDIMAIEQWVNNFQTLGTADRDVKGQIVKGNAPRDASKKTKQHMKAFVHRMFECAIKWGYLSLQRNPIALIDVKGKAKRMRMLNLIKGEQWHRLTEDPDLAPHVRVMMFIAMLLGLRASEILGLRWEDIDLRRGTLSVCRSHVGKAVDDTKTEESTQELPIHEDLRHVLEAWSTEPSVNGWLFGNLITGRPYWRDSLQSDHLVPAGKKVGIPNLGWHDFRHTYRAMIRDLKISLEEQRTLMRHEDIKTTLGYGGKTPAEVSRPANAKVVEMLRKRA